MPGPITQEALDLLGHKISTAAEKAATVGAEVDEVREYVDLETAKLDARLDEHSRQRDADRATVADIKTSIALLQQSMNSVRKIGWAILAAVITSTISGVFAGIFFAMSTLSERKAHEREAFDHRLDRVEWTVGRMQDSRDPFADRPNLTAGGGDRR